MGRILLALQFWEGDKEKAGELARFFASLESTKNPRVDLLLSARWDCDADPKVVHDCKKAFEVYTAKGRTRLTGHPMGSWGLWKDTVEHVRRASIDCRMPWYDCILTFEADCAPLVKGWADRLLDAWNRVEGSRRIAVGHEILPNTTPYPHLNGNLLINGNPEMLSVISGYQCPTKNAWDLPIYPLLKAHGGISIPEMRSGIFLGLNKDWVSEAVSEGVVFVHGDKDGMILKSAQDLIRGESPEGGERLFRVEDKVSSVVEFGATELKLGKSDFVRTVTSGGIIEFDGGYLMAQLDQHLYRFGEHRILLRRATRDLELDNPAEVGGLWRFPGNDRETVYTSPRLVKADGKIWLAYGTETGYPSKVSLQHLALLDINGPKATFRMDLTWGRNNTDCYNPNITVQARDWQFFSRGSNMFWVDQLEPLRVGHMEARRVKETCNGASAAWPREWGTPRPATPLIQVGEEWFGFFHSMSVDGKSFRGFMGAYACRWDGENWVNHRCSTSPLLRGSENDGFRWPRKARYWEHPDVIPTGAVFDVTSKVWKVVFDSNGSRPFVLDFPHEKILASFRGPAILQTRPMPRLPLRDGP